MARPNQKLFFQYRAPLYKLSDGIWYLWVQSVPSAQSAGHRILATVFYYIRFVLFPKTQVLKTQGMCINQEVSHSKFQEMDIFEVPFALKCANNANFLKKSGFLRRLKLVIVTIKTQGNSLKVSLEIRKSVKN